ncbi:hypothetical protein ERO13_A07G122450v2 [Gossypium hirsutum]|nr:hypothetical protein ERO13_A07G122450v2 [Gossypium hirsutum]
MEFVGKSVKKEFKGFGLHSGTVNSFDSSSGFFEIVYEDGDSEELDFHQVASLVMADGSNSILEPRSDPELEVLRNAKQGTLASNANVNLDTNADLNEGVDGNLSGTLDEKGIGSLMDLNLNSNGDIEMKIGFDLNSSGFDLNLNDTCCSNNYLNDNRISCSEGENVKKRGCIDLNLDASCDECSFDLNLGADEEIDKDAIDGNCVWQVEVRESATCADILKETLIIERNDAAEDKGAIVHQNVIKADDCGGVGLEGVPESGTAVTDGCKSFSTLLFLSPFELEDFVTALKCQSPSSLFDSFVYLSSEGSESASECLRSLNWGFLDSITWPIFMVEYLLIHDTQVLCDDMIERSLASETDMDFDRNMNNGVCKKRKATKDLSGGSSFIEEIVDDTTDWNSDDCCLCKMDGNLICCDGCPAAYHSKCVGIVNAHLPEGDWYCPECAIEREKPWLLGIDPHGRLYYNSSGYLLVLDSFDAECPSNYYHRDDLIFVLIKDKYDSLKSLEEIIGNQMKVILKKSNRFHWPDIYTYTYPVDDTDCLFRITSGCVPEVSKMDFCQVQWLESAYMKIWHKSILNALLEANLHHLALSTDWMKHVDSAVVMGCFSCCDCFKASICWWRGGRVSRQLFNWKVLPCSLVSKAARQGGGKKIPGILYPESSDFAKRSRSIAWRAAVESSTSIEQLAFQV